MVLRFERTLNDALTTIGFKNRYHFHVISHKPRNLENSDDILHKYGQTKWKIVDMLNDHFGTDFDLHNWLSNKEDDVAHFLNEAGSNCLSHSQHKIPHKFHLWLGEKGFVVGIEQKGNPFDAHQVHKKKIKTNKGAAFKFYNKSGATIFFDDAKNANTIFLEKLLK